MTDKTLFNLQSNPITTEAVFVIEASSITEDSIITIYDLTEKKIATSTNITETTTLNLERFANGLYLAKFESNDRSKTIKILVQH
ncbi:T9SS type A sorting domain-containing protein [Patiriisocius sp. Uisw_017]|uniref:T9SS type A sorting domain-containing protein n=1 Tax=Patiriisocius sp. Uisw_017 TaxID=3230968 RepID=UPI0039E930E3